MEQFLFLQTRMTLCRASSSRLNHIDSPHLVHLDIPYPSWDSPERRLAEGGARFTHPGFTTNGTCALPESACDPQTSESSGVKHVVSSIPAERITRCAVGLRRRCRPVETRASRTPPPERGKAMRSSRTDQARLGGSPVTSAKDHCSDGADSKSGRGRARDPRSRNAERRRSTDNQPDMPANCRGSHNARTRLWEVRSTLTQVTSIQSPARWRVTERLWASASCTGGGSWSGDASATADQPD